MTMKDPATNTYTGFDIDTVKELAADLGVELEFVPTEWKTLVAGILADKYDMSTSASTTPQRIRTVGFTKSYYQVGTVPLTKKKNEGKFKSFDDINKAGVTVAVTLGTTRTAGQDAVPERHAPDHRAAGAGLPGSAGGPGRRVDHLQRQGIKLVQSHSSLMIVPVAKPAAPADLAFIVPQGDQVWLNYLNHWITIKTNRGFFEANAGKWLPTN